MVKGYKIDKRKLGKRIGFIIETEDDLLSNQFSNIVRGYIGEQMILIKTNLNQEQFDLFTNGKLSSEELHKII